MTRTDSAGPSAASGPLELAVTDLSLVVLIGATGSGKSTFAARHFKPTEVLSSDFCRGLVADDENDQSASADAFDVLHHIAGKRLAAGRLTVVDATSVQRESRRQLVDLARRHDVLPIAVVLDLPEEVCAERNAARPDRAGVHRRVIARHRRELRRSLKGLEREGFRKVHVLRSQQEVDRAVVVRRRRYNDLRHLTGPFDIIGDVHGCRSELETLLTELGYVDGHHPEGRTAVFVGDLVDRGPDTPGVLRRVMAMVASGDALCVPGNHENKLGRWLNGRTVRATHGLAETIEQLEREEERDPGFRARVREFVESLVSHYVLDGGALVVSHAGLPEQYHGRTSGRVRAHALYGDTTGETDAFGLPVRYPWAEEYRGRAAVVYGHTPVPTATWLNNTICLDTGAVFGGKLTALRWPERELVDVPAERVWYEPVRPLASEAPGGHEGRPLDLADVTGRRAVETRHQGRVAVREENAAAALEVMTRFAVDPSLMPYLPPTMAPVPTSRREGYLEHPEEAFAAYASSGVERVVCEEKHMGSRAVALVCRDARTARERFGVTEEGRHGRALHPYRAPVLRRARDHRDRARPGAGGGRRGRALGGAGHRLAAPRRRADAVVAQGHRSAPFPVRRRGCGRPGRLPRRPRGARGRGRAGRGHRRPAGAAARTGGGRDGLHRGVPAVLLARRGRGRRAARSLPAPRSERTQPRQTPARPAARPHRPPGRGRPDGPARPDPPPLRGDGRSGVGPGRHRLVAGADRRGR